MTCNRLALFINPPSCLAHKDKICVRTFLLLIDFVNETAFFQFAHNAFVYDIFETELGAGLPAHGFFDLRLNAGSSNQRYDVVEFGAGSVGVLQIGFAGLPAVFRKNFFALFLASFEKVNSLDVRH